jgi:hypothetical protein
MEGAGSQRDIERKLPWSCNLSSRSSAINHSVNALCCICSQPLLALKRRCLYGLLHAGNLGHSGHRSEGINRG